MNKSGTKARVGGGLLLVAVVWSVASPWLSANRIISAWTEESCYLVALLLVLCGAFWYVRKRSEPERWLPVSLRSAAACCAFLAVVWLALHSNSAFFYWKLKAVSPSAWQQMTSDLDAVGRLSAESGTNYLSSAKPPPKSLQQLGVGVDYAGGEGSLGHLR